MSDTITVTQPEHAAIAIRTAHDICAVGVNAGNHALAVEQIAALSQCVRLLEDQRKARKQPILDAGRAIDEAYREATAPIVGAQEPLKQQLARYEAHLRAEQERQARERAEAAKRLEAESEAFGVTAADLAALPPPPAPVKTATTVRRTSELRVSLPELLAGLDASGGFSGSRPLVTADERAIRGLLEAGIKVPGCSLVTVEAVVLKGAR